MLKVLAIAVLPALIVFIMIQLFGNALLKQGSRPKILVFFALCLAVYIATIVVIATW